ncbi:TraR/DksA family transcriptional regulator [Streptomyces sp. KR80]|uniref:TraR/DksA family transcriptional regulator n=1 Tax=Streptomyces sp. KR80 TaxID=3457426 RepID=UPI003FD13D6E
MAEKATPKKSAAQKAPAKKSAAKKAPPKKAPAEKPSVTKASGAKAPARTTAAAKTKAAQAPAKKAAAPKAAPAKKAAKAAPSAPGRAARKTRAGTVVAKKTPREAPAAEQIPAAATVPTVSAGVAEPGELAVRPGEEPWSAEEIGAARAELQQDALRLRTEIDSAEVAITGLMRESGDGAGDDQADTGAKNITREHELALAANAREMLAQTERALGRIDAGTYGLCESCSRPIGKARMQAFPRATLCVDCKQRQERHF